MKLDLEFKTEGAYQDNRLISYNLTGKYPDTNNKLGIDTAISALNTKQVFSKVAKGKKGIAIAYRTDPIQGQMTTRNRLIATPLLNFDFHLNLTILVWNKIKF